MHFIGNYNSSIIVFYIVPSLGMEIKSRIECSVIEVK